MFGNTEPAHHSLNARIIPLLKIKVVVRLGSWEKFASSRCQAQRPILMVCVEKLLTSVLKPIFRIAILHTKERANGMDKLVFALMSAPKSQLTPIQLGPLFA